MAFGLIQSPVGYGSSLTIEEVSSSGAGNQPRRVTLTGPSLPFMGAEWAFENQLVTTWYPGNATEATQQVLGPRELPSAWEGVWKRTLMGKNPVLFSDVSGGETRIISPYLLREVLESIARDGVRLRVTWSVRGTEAVGSTTSNNAFVVSRNPDGSIRRDRVVQINKRDINVQIIREGRVKTFRTPIDRHTDIRWSIEFHWVSRGGRQDRATSVNESEAADQIALSLEASVNTTIQLLAATVFRSNPLIRKSATQLTLGQLENLANAPQVLVTSLTRQLQQNVNNFRRIAAISKKLQAQPVAIRNAINNLARSTTNAANEFLDAFGRKPAEINTKKQKVSALLRANNTFSAIAAAAAINARTGQQLEASQRRTLASGGNRGSLTVKSSSTTRAGSIIAIHISKSGDTPQTVSMRYFGNVDQAVSILRSNRLPYYTPSFRPGQIIVIPVISSVTAEANV